MMHHEESVKCE